MLKLPHDWRLGESKIGVGNLGNDIIKYLYLKTFVNVNGSQCTLFPLKTQKKLYADLGIPRKPACHKWNDIREIHQ
jgi:hypothetical protein